MDGRLLGEAVPPPSGEGTVVLDIGGERGAVVVYVPATLDGAEIEIRPVGEPWNGTHTGVRQRDLRDGTRFAAVFGDVSSGTHQLRIRGSDTGPEMDVSVVGGHISEARWPATSRVTLSSPIR